MTFSSAEAEVVLALERMRSGLRLVFAGWILLSVGLISAVLAIAAWYIFDSAGVGLAAFALMGILSIVGILLALVGFYAKFVPGAGNLARARPEFGTASKLIRVGHLGGLVTLLLGFLLMLGSLLLTQLLVIGLPLIIVGSVLLLLGYAGTVVMCFKLNNAYKNSLYVAAGVLLIVSIFIPILGFVAWILLYVALGDTVRRLRALPASRVRPA